VAELTSKKSPYQRCTVCGSVRALKTFRDRDGVVRPCCVDEHACASDWHRIGKPKHPLTAEFYPTLTEHGYEDPTVDNGGDERG
jgi:hypothetical protein